MNLNTHVAFPKAQGAGYKQAFEIYCNIKVAKIRPPGVGCTDTLIVYVQVIHRFILFLVRIVSLVAGPGNKGAKYVFPLLLKQSIRNAHLLMIALHEL